jgi:hypothetical protein
LILWELSRHSNTIKLFNLFVILAYGLIIECGIHFILFYFIFIFIYIYIFLEDFIYFFLYSRSNIAKRQRPQSRRHSRHLLERRRRYVCLYFWQLNSIWCWYENRVRERREGEEEEGEREGERGRGRGRERRGRGGPNPGAILDIYWNAVGAMYAYIFGNLIPFGVAMKIECERRRGERGEGWREERERGEGRKRWRERQTDRERRERERE